METCKTCGSSYKNVGQHWRWQPSHRPRFTDHQHDIITGLVMGDGSVYRSNSTPYLRVKMTTLEYLEYLDDIFGILSTGVEMLHTSEEAAQRVRDSGLNEEAKSENYSSIYELRVRSHPSLDEYASWYSSGKKVWPEGIELSPTTLKHWFVGDGTYITNSGCRYIAIGMSNERGNADKVDSYFDNVGIPTPSNYNRANNTFIAEFSVAATEELFQYMGQPLPGFKYKWP